MQEDPQDAPKRTSPWRTSEVADALFAGFLKRALTVRLEEECWAYSSSMVVDPTTMSTIAFLALPANSVTSVMVEERTSTLVVPVLASSVERPDIWGRVASTTRKPAKVATRCEYLVLYTTTSTMPSLTDPPMGVVHRTVTPWISSGTLLLGLVRVKPDTCASTEVLSGHLRLTTMSATAEMAGKLDRAIWMGVSIVRSANGGDTPSTVGRGDGRY
mmetsp:Transcript_44191/g.107838  ORF Transcript_44191/g.107838 Transcript_44191/m.107838 type:complete len:216 (+) Transcript_44191:279-926(+)